MIYLQRKTWISCSRVGWIRWEGGYRLAGYLAGNSIGTLHSRLQGRKEAGLNRGVGRTDHAIAESL